MAERGILMSGPMVRATLDGTKTVTRRVIKPQPDPVYRLAHQHSDGSVSFFVGPTVESQSWGVGPIRCPYGRAPSRKVTRRPITGLSNYEAGDDGNIYRVGSESPLAVHWGGYNRRYAQIKLGNGSDRKNRYVHDMVCRAFYGEPPDGLAEVRHMDGDPSNNRAENLDWGTSRQNALDREAQRDGDHYNSRLSGEDVAAIRADRDRPRSGLASQYGVSVATIDDIRGGRTWSPPQPQPPRNLPAWEPLCVPGDYLYVRHSFWRYTPPATNPSDLHVWDEFTKAAQWASGEVAEDVIPDTTEPGWTRHPSIHMPKWAARIWLRVTDVRVERVQEISCEDAEAEGVGGGMLEDGSVDYPEDLFRDLWDSLNASRGYGWDVNPWVWCVEFERCERPEVTSG